MMEPIRWAEVVVVDAAGRVVARQERWGMGAPDLSLIDELAQDALVARRHGRRICLRQVAPELRALIELAGLEPELLAVDSDALP
jgi:hypothetical protein